MALNASKPTQVTELTREQVATVLTKPLEQASVFLAAGPRIYDTAGPLRIPAGPAPAAPDALEWVGESEQIPEHDPEFDELQLLPSTMRSANKRSLTSALWGSGWAYCSAKPPSAARSPQRGRRNSKLTDCAGQMSMTGF